MDYKKYYKEHKKEIEEIYDDKKNIDWKKVRESQDTSEWTDEYEENNKKDLKRIKEMESNGEFIVVCQGINSNKRKRKEREKI